MFTVLPRWYRCLREVVWHFVPRRVWLQRANRHRWLFILGVNRSGKTTLSNLLKLHPAMSVIPNASNMSFALSNSITEGCPHVWIEKLERFRLTEADKERVDPSRLLFDWLTFNPRPRATIVVESDIPAIQMRWFQALLKDSYFVGVVRNGYAVSSGLRLKEGYPIERCAAQWARANELLLSDSTRIHNFRLIRYEDFVADPAGTLETLASFAGFDPACLRPFLTQGWRLGNTDRQPSLLRDANPEMIEMLTPEELRKIRETASAMLERFSYRDSRE